MFEIYLFTQAMDCMSFFKSKSNNTILAILSIIVLAFMFAFIPVDSTPIDTQIYESYYNNPGWISKFESGYMLFSKIFQNLGITYWWFRFFLAIIGFSLMYFGLCNFKINKSFFIFLYTLIPFLEDAIQLRNFLMFMIVFYAISLLVKPTNSHYIMAILLIMIASKFQSLGLIFVSIPILDWGINHFKNFLTIYVAIVSLMIILFSIPAIRSLIANGILINLANSMDRASSIGVYITRMQAGKIILADIVAHIFFIVYTKTEGDYLIASDFLDKEQIRLVVLMQRISYGILIVVPLYFLAYNFDRTLKDAFSFLFVFMCVDLSALFSLNRKRFKSIVTILSIFIIFYFFSYYTYGPRWEQVVLPILFHNTFFSGMYKFI